MLQPLDSPVSAPPSIHSGWTLLTLPCSFFFPAVVDAFSSYHLITQLVDFIALHEATCAQLTFPGLLAYCCVTLRGCTCVLCSPSTHDCYLEALNIVIVLISTQLRHAELSAPPTLGASGAVYTAGPTGDRILVGRDAFLELMMLSGNTAVDAPSVAPASPQASSSPAPTPSMSRSSSAQRNLKVIAALLNNFMKQLDAPQATASVLSHYTGTPTNDKPGSAVATTPTASVLDKVTSASVYLIAVLPWQIYSYFRPPAILSRPIAQRSVKLFLLLTHNCRSRGWANPYRVALSQLADDGGNLHDLNFQAVHVRMQELYSALCKYVLGCTDFVDCL